MQYGPGPNHPLYRNLPCIGHALFDADTIVIVNVTCDSPSSI